MGATLIPNSSGLIKAIEKGQGLLKGVQYDEVQATYPNEITEVYSFLFQSILQATITVVYTDGSKTVLVSAVRS